MHISDFDYDLPPERIAQHPIEKRDASRLLVLHRDETPMEHGVFSDIKNHLRDGDLLILNDTRVLPARLEGTREGFSGKVEVLLLKPRKPHIWEALTKPARKLNKDTVITLGDGAAQARVVAAGEDGLRLLQFDPDTNVIELMKSHGHIPLPPYISRPDEPEDRERYQTVYSRAEGAVAAPTAGLHFTDELLGELEAAGIRRATVTLHVGIGTFRPVMSEDPRLHPMEPEWYEIPEATAAAFQECRERNGRVVACGTTAVRALESAVEMTGGPPRLEVGPGWADIFIYEPYTFRAVDAMITNFHLPRSTLLMLVSAFAGLEKIRRAYRAAIREKYRFYSYGDAMLIA